MSSDNQRTFDRAVELIPGGVNSPVRAFGAVGGTPPIIASGSGARIRDIEGKEYIDYVGSWGPLILGHAHPEVLKAVERAARNGLSFGAPTASEVEMAELIVGTLPSVEQVRLVSSGTEATMTAIRLARGIDRCPLIESCLGGVCQRVLGATHEQSQAREQQPPSVAHSFHKFPGANDVRSRCSPRSA